MLAVERHLKIVDFINMNKSARVSELSKMFSVTEETIRRDLEKLEKKGKLLRSHGGAVVVQSSDKIETSFSEREVTNVLEKSLIAEEAIKLIKENNKIILDASSTAWYMAKKIPNIPLTVMTNSIKVAMELNEKSNITVISTGGTLLSKSLSFVGSLAESSFDLYHFDKAFISCSGMDIKKGLTESNEQQARIKEQIIKNVDVVNLMIDHTKLHKISFAKICDMSEIDYLITDKTIDDRLEQKCLEDETSVVYI